MTANAESNRAARAMDYPICSAIPAHGGDDHRSRLDAIDADRPFSVCGPSSLISSRPNTVFPPSAIMMALAIAASIVNAWTTV
ncbi:hypothetical protein [Sphingobium cupriresistens]|nr:hypothetical protein [Sphingobium cupriresistens]MBJ7376862.1 hypothetical protein [Sphingobium sp.]